MTRNSSFAILVAATLACFGASVGAAHAGPTPGRLDLHLQFGDDIPINGSMHEGLTAAFADLGPVFPALAGQSGDVVINPRSYDDFYGATPLYRLGAALGLSDNLELFLGFTHTEGESQTVQIGTVTTGGVASPLFSRFSDYRSSAVELGARAWLGERFDRFRPYAAVRLGAARTDAIANTLSAPGAGSGETIVPFYNDSTTYAAGVDVGATYRIAHIRAINADVELGAEVGARFIGALDEDDTALGALGAQSLNDKSGRVSAPVTITLRMRFGAGDS